MIDLEEIKKITLDIKSYTKCRFVRLTDWKEIFEKMIYEIAYAMSKWSGNTYVGKEKDKELEKVYQSFFESVYSLIIIFDKNKDKTMFLENKFVDSIKYHGKVYRYLGHGDSIDKRKKYYIKPIYNDIYVSWSKNEDNHYLESKLYGKITKLYCDIPNDQYGLDYERFQDFINNSLKEEFYISRGRETEVIFPTIEEYIYDIKYM